MSALAALYPSSSSGSGSTLSPLSAPAAATPEATASLEPLQAAEPLTDATASPEVRSPASAPPAQPQDPAEVVDDADVALEAQIDGAIVEHGEKPSGEAEPEAPVDLTVDERANHFANARLEEIPAHSVTDFNAVVRSPADHEMDMAIVQDGLRAAVKLGLGITTMEGIWKAAVDASRSPIRTTQEAAHAALAAEFGDRTDATLASARAWIDQAEKSWPNVRAWLYASGLGNDPGFAKLIARAAQRRGL